MPHLQPSFPEMDNRPKVKVPYLRGRQEMKLPYPGNVAFQSCWLIVLWGELEILVRFSLDVPTSSFLVLILKNFFNFCFLQNVMQAKYSSWQPISCVSKSNTLPGMPTVTNEIGKAAHPWELCWGSQSQQLCSTHHAPRASWLPRPAAEESLDLVPSHWYGLGEVSWAC